MMTLAKMKNSAELGVLYFCCPLHQHKWQRCSIIRSSNQTFSLQNFLVLVERASRHSAFLHELFISDALKNHHLSGLSQPLPGHLNYRVNIVYHRLTLLNRI